MQINKIKDASIHFGKALFAATFDPISVPILTSVYQATNSENDNTDENRQPSMQVPKSDNATARERNIHIPPYA